MQKVKSWILVAGPIVAVLLLSWVLWLAVLLRPEEVRHWLVSFGPAFVLVYVVIQALGIVIAPFGAGFIWLTMLAVLGPVQGLLLAYLVMTPMFCVNFWLARKYGRGIVKKFVGEKGLNKVDHFAADAGVGTGWVF